MICNLQPTKHDKKADLVISTYVDVIMEKVLKRLGVEQIEYNEGIDPTKKSNGEMEWTIQPKLIKEIDNQHKELLKEAKKRKTNDVSDGIKIKTKKQKSLVDEKDE